MSFRASDTALCLIDFQRGLCQEGPECLAPPLAQHVRETRALDSARKLLEAGREGGLFVVHVRLAFEPTYALRTNSSARFSAYADNGALRRGSAAVAGCEEVAPLDEEPVVEKACMNPFIGTPLFEALVRRKVFNVVLAGVATNLAVESAARFAVDSGLRPTVVSDACASFTEELHTYAVEDVLPFFAEVIRTDDFKVA